MKFTSLLLLLPLVGKVALAQQQPLVFFYRDVQSYLNPAAVATDFLRNDYNLTAGAAVRTQWTDTPDSPQTQLLWYEYLFPEVKVIAGGHLLNDRAGPTSLTALTGRAAVYLNRSGRLDDGGLLLGLSGGLIHHRISTIGVTFLQANDPLQNFGASRMVPNLGAGVFGYLPLNGDGANSFRSGKRAQTAHKLYAGIGTPYFFETELVFLNDGQPLPQRRVRHLYGNLGAYFFLGGGTFLEISTWTRRVRGAPWSTDFNLRYQLHSRIWMGMGYGLRTHFSGEFGILLNDGEDISTNWNLRLAYGFTYALNGEAPSLGGSHEISLVYLLDRQ